ncbi:MAG: hypothetical protein ACRDZ2_04710 [Ilumatobacteraceae bacterium]
MSLDDLRQRRHALQELDDAISYVRRVAQGRADLARAELDQRHGGGRDGDRQDELRDVLSDRLLGGPGRPPRPIEDWSGHPRAEQLDRLCAEHGYGRLPELDVDALTALVAALDEFEAAVSSERRAVEHQLDELTEQFVAEFAATTAEARES